MSFTHELRSTSDALESVIALPDTVRTTSLAIEHSRTFEDAGLSVRASFSDSVHARYAIEDDRSAALSASANMQAGERLEIRGTLAYAFSDEGDDLVIGADGVPLAIIGIRTPTHDFSASAEAGLRFTPALAILVAASLRASYAGATAFEGGVLPSLKLEPDRLRPAISVALRHEDGPASLKLSAGLRGMLSEEGSGDLALATLAVEFAREAPQGIALALGVGMQLLDARGTVGADVRPAFRFAVAVPLLERLRLTSSLAGDYDIDDSDDPLGSWRMRGEAEVALNLRPDLAIGAGLFAERLDHLALSMREHARGAYAEIEYRAAPRLTLAIRGDLGRTRGSLFRHSERVRTGIIALRAAL